MKKEKFINYYSTMCLQTRQQPPLAVVKDFNFLITALSSEDFKTSVLPLFESQAKKNPDVTLYVLKQFLETTTLDLSPVLNTISFRLLSVFGHINFAAPQGTHTLQDRIFAPVIY